MANKHLEALVEAVAKLQQDVEWLKRGMFAMFAMIGTIGGAVVIGIIRLHI